MAKVTFNLVVSIIGAILAALRVVMDLGTKIADLIDNGKVDGSFERPVWMLNVEAGLEYAQRAASCLGVARDLAKSDVPPVESQSAE